MGGDGRFPSGANRIRRERAPDKRCRARQSFRRSKRLLAEMLERDLDAFVEQLLIVGPELLAPAGTAVEELRHLADRGMRLALDLGGAAEIGLPVKVEIYCIMKGLTWHDAGNGLAADAQHFGARADGGDVLVAPPKLVVQPEARSG